MGAERRNPAPTAVAVAFAPVPTLPGAPSAGATAFLIPLSVNLVYDGVRWGTADGSGFLLPDGGVGGAIAVVEVGGVVVPCDPSIHDHVDGVVAGTSGGLVLVRQAGYVDGLAGLVPGATYFVGAVAGTIATSAGLAAQLHIGWAGSTSRLFVRPGTTGIL